MFILTVIGIGLAILGALILLKFPDRPGGKIAWGNAEVSSVGAGLPLIVLGVICLLIANRGPGTPGLTSTPTPTITPISQSSLTHSPTISLTPPTTTDPAQDCFAEFFQGVAKDRIATIEEGARAVEIIGPHQPRQGVIAVKLTENGQPIGGVKFFLYSNSPSNYLFKIDAVVDSMCQRVEGFSNASRGGDKHVLQNWDSLRMTLGTSSYELALGYSAGLGVNFDRVSE